MSIHAHLSEESQRQLAAQKRNCTISSIVIAVLVIVLIALVLGIFLLPNIGKEEVSIVTYKSNVSNDDQVQEKKVQNQVQRKPTAPPNASVKVIASNTASAMSIPVPEVEIASPVAEFGDSEDFGSGWGDGGAGLGGGFASIPATMRKHCSKGDRMARVQEMGGLPETEDAVEKGLEWLLATQNPDGSWGGTNKAAMTGFAILAYLGRCETPQSEKYGVSCLNGIVWLVNLGMQNEGKLSQSLGSKSWPYEHAIATYAMCEAAAFCKQLKINVPNLPDVTTKAVDFIIANQHENGGWGYGYDTSSSSHVDLSVTAWHTQALKAALHTGVGNQRAHLFEAKGHRIHRGDAEQRSWRFRVYEQQRTSRQKNLLVADRGRGSEPSDGRDGKFLRGAERRQRHPR
ncbi:MAG: prenyltransferase/squalene oxidase repeat-containing protein [Luteolibacter sp.]